MKFSCQENILPGSSLEEKLSSAEAIGFEGVELWGRNISKRLEVLLDTIPSFKIKVSTICSGYPGDLLHADRKQRELAIEGIVERLKASSDLGAVGLIVVPTFGGPKLPDLYPLYENVRWIERRLLVEELRILDKHAVDYGTFILLEPLNRYETHFLNTVGEAVDIIEDVGGENIRLMADFFHMNIEEDDLVEALKNGGQYLSHLHLADSNRLVPGAGHIDFSAPLLFLKQIQYKYYLAFECRVPEPRFERLRTSLNFLRRLIT